MMTSRQIILVQNSWQHIKGMDAIVVGQLFYAKLFESNPELKPLFKTAIPEQSKKLLSMIGYIVVRLDKLDDIIVEIEHLAQRHVRYGIEEKHYDIVGAALIWTLKNGLSKIWNSELEEAWTACYTMLASAMIDASQEAMYT